MAKFQFILWLAYWYSQADSFDFEWDQGNATKNSTKHGVTTDEIESFFFLKLAVPLGRQVSPAVDEERLCLIGPSNEGRMLSVVFTLRDGRVRPISARLANQKERTSYEEIRQTLEKL